MGARSAPARRRARTSRASAVTVRVCCALRDKRTLGGQRARVRNVSTKTHRLAANRARGPRRADSRPPTPGTIDPHAVRYDAIVIGSGFGGGVAACRLAEAGKTVCVLERGRRFAGADYPD